MKRLIIPSLVLLNTLFFPGIIEAQELTADEIVRRANLASYYADKDGMADVQMTITDSQGRERKRELRILRLNKEQGGEQNYYVYFTKPADVAKMVFMVHKHIDRDDDRWLYLPAMDLVRRIASGDKRSSFAGSHFVYEDVSGRSVEADSHELVGAEENSYKVRNTPKEKKGVEFAYYDVWIDKANFLPFKAEYYDAQNQLIKRVDTLEVKDIQGFPTAVKSSAEDLQRGGKTVIEFGNVSYDVGLSEEIFTERYLRQPPVKWIK